MFTKSKNNRKVGANSIEREEYTEAYHYISFLHDKMDCNIGEFINLLKGSMNVEEYSLKFTLWSKCAQCFFQIIERR